MDNTVLSFIEILRRHSLTLALAESCTGGLVASMIVENPGVSDVFLGGVVAYANSAKEALLDVSAETLIKFGAVSENTAAEMVKGARQKFGADIAISVTGVAGPDGGSPEKPAGLVYIGFAGKGKVRTKRLLFENKTRTEVRQLSAIEAINFAIEFIDAD